MTTIQTLLTFIYGEDAAKEIELRIGALIAEFAPEEVPAKANGYFDQRDAILITYGDMVQTDGQPPLKTLRQFCEKHLQGVINGVHLLPFYPWSSDDGFSVIDYLQVDPVLGDWPEVEAFHDNFKLMFDAVINHISQESAWYQAFLRDEAPYKDYFTVADPETDLSAVFRPRALPLLTAANTPSGTKHVWTTFSADQIDLNYESADLLLDVLRVLLTYVKCGADLIRLDAIGFMWKEIGTRCLHLPQTHALIQLMRLVLDGVAPSVALVSETNVPHHENISYFGDGTNEAQMVYNFSLPPLLLHTFHTGNADALVGWAKTLEQPSDQTTFFNFCASHDGIGVTPARGILTDAQVEAMADRVKALGGFVSYKTNSDGSQSAYELNINFLDALGTPDADEDEELVARRFLCSQAIMLALRGVPGIYFHSLFGSRSWLDGVAQTGRNRTINRQKLQRDLLEVELSCGLRKRVFEGYKKMLQIRASEKAFHPNGEQKFLTSNGAFFGFWRAYEDESVLCLFNVSNQTVATPNFAGLIPKPLFRLSEQNEMAPYEVLWIK